METFDNWIDGRWVEPARRMETTTPFTGEVWAEVADDPAAVDVAVAAARKAFDGEWSAMSGAQRGACMRRLGELLTRDAEMLGQIESRDNGKIIRETGAQAKSLQSYYDFFAGLADKVGGDKLPDPGPTSVVSRASAWAMPADPAAKSAAPVSGAVTACALEPPGLRHQP